MVNLKSSRSENSFEYFQRNNVKTFRSNHLKNYFETVSPLILASLLTICILWAIPVLLWIMTIIDFNCALENDVKTGKNTEGIKPRTRYVCDTSKSFIYYPNVTEKINLICLCHVIQKGPIKIRKPI